MTLNPNSYQKKQTLQPGARGEIFQQDFPGYRGQGDRINRTNMKISSCDHDVPNIKYELDNRLKNLFRYGWAIGFNQIVIPKGRIVAIDKSLNTFDFDTQKAYNTLTLANGGADVKLRGNDYKNIQDTSASPVGIGKDWTPIDPDAYSKSDKDELVYRPFKKITQAALTTLEECEDEKAKGKKGAKTVAAKNSPVLAIDPATGLVTADGVVTEEIRLGNIPIGMIERNEYTRDYAAHNGMNPGPVLTDKLVEVPMFLLKEKAEMNPWGTAYGMFLPGDFVKSDENGRFIVSPLSRPEIVATMSAGEIELERQQVVGQVFEVKRDLVPAGAAKYAQWALSDRLNFDEFNPDVWRMTGRRGEDNIEHSPYSFSNEIYSNGLIDMTGRDFIEGSGYPYDRTMSNHDLHMIYSSRRKHSNRFGLEHMLDQGIPGLTDGHNVISKELGPEELGTFNQAASEDDYRDVFFETADVHLESLKLAVSTREAEEGDYVVINELEVNQKLDLKGESVIADALYIKYIDLHQGKIVFSVNQEKKSEVHAALNGKQARIFAKYTKRGQAGIPTNLDWDGCSGTVSILLQK